MKWNCGECSRACNRILEVLLILFFSLSVALDLGISDTSSLYVSRHPLPEDVALLGFSPLAGKHERYDFDWSNCNGLLSSVKETVLRVHRLQSFGQAMAESKVRV